MAWDFFYVLERVLEMIEININEMGKFYGANRIFKNISFSVKTGERIGLIGPNGCGKTTILKILTGVEDYQEGQLAIRKGLRMGYLNQIPLYDKDLLVEDVMTLAFEDLIQTKKKMTELELKLQNTDDGNMEDLLKQYGELCHYFEEAGGYDIETKVNKIATGLNISNELRKRQYDSLSGGEKTRIELAKVLLEEPDLLLLDEPSNHLDMASIEWLEEFLKVYTGSALIVSHDRYFLDRVVTGIVEMSFDNTCIYNGNYSYYVIEKERRFLIEMKYYDQQQKEIKRMEEQIKRYKIWGEMRNSNKMFKKAKELEKRLSKVDKMERPVFENKKVKLLFDTSSRSGKRVLEVDGVSKSFDDNHLFTNVNLEVFFGESVCILGNNGTGKSTMLKIIIGEAAFEEGIFINMGDEVIDINKDEGMVKFGSRVKIGYLPQEIRFEDEDMTILEYFQNLHNLPDYLIRKELAKVLFVKDDVEKKIGSLSGGEKSRLKLCSLMYDKANFLLLDEPTNHLDIESREVLEEMLIDYEGTILFVSHDRYFIAKLSNRIAEMNDGSLNYYSGNYEYFRNLKAKEQMQKAVSKETANEKSKKVVKSRTPKSRTVKKANIRYLDELRKLEAFIDKLENELDIVKEDMTKYTDNAEKLLYLYNQQSILENALLDKYEELEEISGIVLK